MNRISIQDISVGDSLCSVFLISTAAKSESKNGPFWRIELRDATGTLEAKIWSPLSQKVTGLKAGDFVEVKGKTSLFREQMQFTIEAIRPVEDPELLDISDFLPTSSTEPAEILADIESLAQEELTYTPWKNFVKTVLNDPRIRNKLLLAPAAKSVHHAYAGGLLEHMHSVAGICLKFSDHYPELDRQTLFVGGLFHDIGKLEELSGGLLNDYTNEGRLLGHIVQGIMLLKPYLEKSRVDPILALHLEHLILSHHGEPDFGAPKTPMTPEAFALHYADNIDAKLAQCRDIFSHMPQILSPRTTSQIMQAQNNSVQNNCAKYNGGQGDNGQNGDGRGGDGQNSKYLLPTEPLSPDAVSTENDRAMAAQLSQVTQTQQMKQEAQNAIMQEAESELEDIAWSPWVNLLGRTLCRMPKTPQKQESENSKTSREPKEKQGSLLG